MTYTVNSTSTEEGVQSAPERELRNALDDGSLTEIEIAWSDPFGHAQGKRIPASQFLNRALGTGFAFCEASLGWDTVGTVIDSLRLTNWSGGYPDVYAVPDFSTYKPLPWRPRVGHVISDIVAHDRSPSRLDPRAVLKKVLARLASLGFTAKIGVEFELYLLNLDGSRIPGRHSRLLARERQRPRSGAQRPLRHVERIHGAGGRRNRVRPWPDRDEPGLHRRAGGRRRRNPAQVRRQGGGAKTRQDRQLHAEAVHRALGKFAAPAHLAVARRRTRVRGGRRRRNKLPYTQSQAYSSTYRRSRCSAHTRSTPTDDSHRTRSRPRP